MTFGAHLTQALFAAKLRLGAKLDAAQMSALIDEHYRQWQQAHRAPHHPVMKEGGLRDPLFDALAEIEGGTAELTSTARSTIAVKQAELLQAAPQVTPAEIRRRTENYRTNFPTWPLTVPALVKHWTACATNGRKVTPLTPPPAVAVNGHREPNYFGEAARKAGIDLT